MAESKEVDAQKREADSPLLSEDNSKRQKLQESSILKPSALDQQASIAYATIKAEASSTSNENSSSKKMESKESFSLESALNTSLFKKSSSTKETTVSNSTAPSFVFGQNISDRVVGLAENSEKPKSVHVEKDGDKNSNLFACAEECIENGAKSSNDVVTESEIKTPLEEVPKFTGEENESNVMQAHCKIFQFEGGESQSWLERGSGIIRLNDMNEGENVQSRLVMRRHGTYQVILNTKIFPEMSVDRPNPKAIRLSAITDNGIKTFLVKGNPVDLSRLYSALEYRVMEAKNRSESSSKNVSEVSNSSPDDESSTSSSHTQSNERLASSKNE